MALNGANGYLYLTTAMAASTTARLTSGTWYRIRGKAVAASVLPANLSTGDVFKQISSGSPVTTGAFSSNDAVEKLTLTKLAFVTDVSMSASKEKFDETVQSDDVKSYQVSSKSEKTGSINGYWIDNDRHQQLLLKNVDTVLEHTTTGGITRTSPVTTVRRFMLSRDESTASGAQVWEHLPVIIESLNSDKPMEGPQSFTMNYTAVGAEKPNTYILDN
jgi:hypothetical protein